MRLINITYINTKFISQHERLIKLYNNTLFKVFAFLESSSLFILTLSFFFFIRAVLHALLVVKETYFLLTSTLRTGRSIRSSWTVQFCEGRSVSPRTCTSWPIWVVCRSFSTYRIEMVKYDLIKIQINFFDLLVTFFFIRTPFSWIRLGAQSRSSA